MNELVFRACGPQCASLSNPPPPPVIYLALRPHVISWSMVSSPLPLPLAFILRFKGGASHSSPRFHLQAAKVTTVALESCAASCHGRPLRCPPLISRATEQRWRVSSCWLSCGPCSSLAPGRVSQCSRAKDIYLRLKWKSYNVALKL